MEAQQRATFGETAAERAERVRQEALDDLHDRYGLTMGPPNPTPIDKTRAAVDLDKENPSDDRRGRGALPRHRPRTQLRMQQPATWRHAVQNSWTVSHFFSSIRAASISS